MRTSDFLCDRPLFAEPPEEWELPCNRREGKEFYKGVTIYPKTPITRDEIPAGALEALNESCGIEGLNQIFILPWDVRLVGINDRKIITPASVLGLGTRGVGLWTGKPDAGMKAVIPLDELAAIEDVVILLYGRLSFLSRSGRVTVRYNTAARNGMKPALLELRRRLAGPSRTVPRESPAALPFKWDAMVHSEPVCLGGDAVAFRYALSPKTRHAVEQAHLLVLNSRELVYLRDPYNCRHGAVCFIVPRAAISGVRVAGNRLVITSKEADFRMVMAPELRDAALRWLKEGGSN